MLTSEHGTKIRQYLTAIQYSNKDRRLNPLLIRSHERKTTHLWFPLIRVTDPAGLYADPGWLYMDPTFARKAPDPN